MPADDVKSLPPIRIKHASYMPPANMPHSHFDHEIYYFHSGKCNFVIGSQFYALEPGDLILMNGLTWHSANINPDYGYERTIVHFNPDYLQSWIPKAFSINLLQPFSCIKHYRFSLKGQSRLEFEATLQKLEQMQHASDPIGKHRFSLSLLDFFLLLYELCDLPDSLSSPALSARENNVQRVMAYLDRHYALDIHLEDLGKHLHLDRHHLSKLFKEVTGMTIFHYLTHLRINHAKVKLSLDPTLPIMDVSYQTGFKHHAHFSRVFKQFVGCSPDQFRKSRQSD
ncbi:MAG: AraC family transcriptional regulator [Paenibacillus sp.]|nr:AraC family transcriptional regulator [Paenibacillus sp.]